MRHKKIMFRNFALNIGFGELEKKLERNEKYNDSGQISTVILSKLYRILIYSYVKCNYYGITQLNFQIEKSLQLKALFN